MMHPDTELRLIHPEIGHGVVATRLIPAGSITWVRDELDQVFTPAQVEALGPAYRRILDKYTFVDARGSYVLCWDLARFVNHSCKPTCLGPGLDFEIAVRDIHPGEELTDDYGTLNSANDFTCCCGLPECRKEIHPSDLLAHGDRWDAEIRAVFPRIATLPQPLWPLLREKREVERALAKEIEVPSCRLNYHPLNDARKRAEVA